MTMVINTNTASINAQRNLSLSGSALATTMQRLSSGLRVNSAKDDAAGLAIAERMQAQSKGLAVAARNANDGISLAQTAEGALGKMGDMLQRMRELSVQSSNATNSTNDRQALHAELAQLRSEIDRVAKTTTFNGQHVLNGRFAGGIFQVGAGAGEHITVGAITNAKANSLGQTTYGASTTAPIKASDISDLSAIAAGTLTIRIGTQEQVQLDAIAAASSGQERLGQIVAAINAKTADTGLSAFLVADTSNADTYTVELRRAGKEGVAISGFTAAATGVGRNAAASPLGIPSDVHYEHSETTGLITDYIDYKTIGTSTFSIQTGYMNLIGSSYIRNYIDAVPTEYGDALSQALDEFSSTIVPLAYSDTTGTTPATNTVYTPGYIQRWRALADTHPTAADREAAIENTSNIVVGALKKLRDDLQTILEGQQNINLLQFDEKYNQITTKHTWTEVNTAVTDLNTQITDNLGGTALSIPTLTAESTEEEIQAVREMVMASASSLVNGGFGITTQQIHTRKGLQDIAITTQAGAWEAMVHIDAAITQVNSARAQLGALQTRFEKSIENIQVMNENTAAARGRIVDADFAQETAHLSRTQILQQAGTAMVAQANQLPQNVLSLLR